MIKNNLIRVITILIIIFGFSLTRCTKNKLDLGPSDTSTLQQLSKDQSDVLEASDDGLNDASDVISPDSMKSKKVPLHAILAITFSGDTSIYTITYDGNNGWNRVRTGKIIIKKITMTPWSQQHAIVWVTFVNYRVSKLLTNKSITLNGTKTFENVTGGLPVNLGNGVSQVIQQVTGALQLTFDDSTKRTWNIARRRTFTGTWSQLVLTTDGFGSSTGYSNLEAWGTNRNGELFYTQISQPVVRKLSTCGFNPSTGIIVHQIPSDNKSATITFGFDNNDQPVSSSGSACPDKYKLDWVKNGRSGTSYILI